MARCASPASGGEIADVGGASSVRWSPFDFVGTLSAVATVLAIPRAAAQAMLPAGLELAEQDLVSDPRHPLVLVLGRQSEVRARWLPFGFGYLEVILAVPFVRHLPGRRSAAGRFCYAPRLFLDRRLPTVAGRLLYGYDKLQATMAMTEVGYEVADPVTGERLLGARFGPAGARLEPGRVRRAASWLGLPVISRAASGWRYSFADLGLDHADVRPLEVRLTIERSFVPGLPVGETVCQGLDNHDGRAFRLRTSWTLAGPCAQASFPRHAGLDKRP